MPEQSSLAEQFPLERKPHYPYQIEKDLEKMGTTLFTQTMASVRDNPKITPSLLEVFAKNTDSIATILLHSRRSVPIDLPQVLNLKKTRGIKRTITDADVNIPSFGHIVTNDKTLLSIPGKKWVSPVTSVAMAPFEVWKVAPGKAAGDNALFFGAIVVFDTPYIENMHHGKQKNSSLTCRVRRTTQVFWDPETAIPYFKNIDDKFVKSITQAYERMRSQLQNVLLTPFETSPNR